MFLPFFESQKIIITEYFPQRIFLFLELVEGSVGQSPGASFFANSGMKEELNKWQLFKEK